MKNNFYVLILFFIFFTPIACEKRPDNIKVVKYFEDSTLLALYNKMDIPNNDFKLVDTYHHETFALNRKYSLIEAVTYQDINHTKFRHDKLYLKGNERVTVFTYHFKNVQKFEKMNLKKSRSVSNEPLLVGEKKFNVVFDLKKIPLLQEVSFRYDVIGKVINNQTLTNNNGIVLTILGDFLVDINEDSIADLYIKSLNEKSTYNVALFNMNDEIHLFLTFPSSQTTNSNTLFNFIKLNS